MGDETRYRMVGLHLKHLRRELGDVPGDAVAVQRPEREVLRIRRSSVPGRSPSGSAGAIGRLSVG
jgi:hypothetical protein